MGKKNKHSKDKLHKTVSELYSHHVGTNRDLELSTLHRRLKFDSCCLTLSPISDKPVGLCDDDGYCYVFESERIVKFLEKYQIHPITGKKVSAKDLIELKFHKDTEDQYQCPVLYKLFNQHSKIVANRKTGHVYSYEAYQKLNLKTNNFKDLLTDESFDKGDIVTIQDPERAETKWAVTNFHYVKNKLKLDDDDTVSNIRNIEQSDVLKATLKEFKSKESSIIETFNRLTGQDANLSTDNVVLDKINSASYSDGSLARSVTSTTMPVTSEQRPALLSNAQILYPRIKKKGYVQMVTNKGPLNIELYCDRAPKTCHNFLLLASRGYYDNTCFHRLIKNFILQGGDPTGTGSGGQSAWGEPFEDECHNDLKHVGRGVLAMANSGPGTNKSQFYITLKGTWDHLDGKHTVFGRVVGGDNTLDRIEEVDVDKKDKPRDEIKIVRFVKYVDPFEQTEAIIESERQLLSKRSMNKNNGGPLKKFRSGIGSYVDCDALESRANPISTGDSSSNGGSKSKDSPSSLTKVLANLGSKQKPKRDFSNW